MKRILWLIFIFLISSYINCSACSNNKDANDYETCSKLQVDNPNTQVCIKNASSKGCKQTTICTEALYVNSDDKCSRLSVDSSKKETHTCIKNPDNTKTNCIEIEKCNSVDSINYSFDCLKYPVSNGKQNTHVCTKNSNSEENVCKETNMCLDIMKGATNEICSKLSVSSDKINTHTCILGPQNIQDISECETLLKNKYRIPMDEELIILKGDTLNGLNSDIDIALFSVSAGAFLPLSDCKLEKCIEENICTKVKYVNSDDQCSKLEVSAII